MFRTGRHTAEERDLKWLEYVITYLRIVALYV